jgi:hypothetical protein
VYLVQRVFRSLDFGAAAALPVGGRTPENTGFFLQLLLTENEKKVKKENNQSQILSP